MTINTAVLPHTGETVAARKDGSPKTFANRTQAENFTRGMAGVEVIRRGRPFYVRMLHELAVTQ